MQSIYSLLQKLSIFKNFFLPDYLTPYLGEIIQQFRATLDLTPVTANPTAFFPPTVCQGCGENFSKKTIQCQECSAKWHQDCLPPTQALAIECPNCSWNTRVEMSVHKECVSCRTKIGIMIARPDVHICIKCHHQEFLNSFLSQVRPKKCSLAYFDFIKESAQLNYLQDIMIQNHSEDARQKIQSSLENLKKNEIWKNTTGASSKIIAFDCNKFLSLLATLTKKYPGISTTFKDSKLKILLGPSAEILRFFGAPNCFASNLGMRKFLCYGKEVAETKRANRKEVIEVKKMKYSKYREFSLEFSFHTNELKIQFTTVSITNSEYQNLKRKENLLTLACARKFLQTGFEKLPTDIFIRIMNESGLILRPLNYAGAFQVTIIEHQIERKMATKYRKVEYHQQHWE